MNLLALFNLSNIGQVINRKLKEDTGRNTTT